MGSSGIPELYNSGIIPEVRLKADLIRTMMYNREPSAQSKCQITLRRPVEDVRCCLFTKLRPPSPPPTPERAEAEPDPVFMVLVVYVMLVDS